ncbi:MAG: hypothetical protein R3C56_14670 [Pirellulaceae bacterium]
MNTLIGVSVESGEYPIQPIISTLSNLGSGELATLGIGVTSCLLLILLAADWHRCSNSLVLQKSRGRNDSQTGAVGCRYDRGR